MSVFNLFANPRCSVSDCVVEAASVQEAETLPHSQNGMQLLNRIQGATMSISPVWMSDFQQHKCH